jgi:hypothetical protein
MQNLYLIADDKNRYQIRRRTLQEIDASSEQPYIVYKVMYTYQMECSR